MLRYYSLVIYLSLSLLYLSLFAYLFKTYKVDNV